MALPPQYRTPRMEMLEAVVASTPREKLMEFPVLQPLDHQLIGAFIQQFNYMDFNLRRAVETFAHASLLSENAAKKYPKLHSSDVATTVQDAVGRMDVTIEDIPDTITRLKIIERRREIRNLVGHWAARRFPNEDAIVLLTKDEKDALQTGGAYLRNGHVKTAVMDLAPIRMVLAEELVPLELWLARKTTEWRKRYIGD